jgi:hypothetical protein
LPNVVLDALRIEHSVTQEDNARAIGHSQPYVHERVQRKRTWTLREVEKMAPPFKLTPLELLQRAGERRLKKPGTNVLRSKRVDVPSVAVSRCS